MHEREQCGRDNDCNRQVAIGLQQLIDVPAHKELLHHDVDEGRKHPEPRQLDHVSSGNRQLMGCEKNSRRQANPGNSDDEPNQGSLTGMLPYRNGDLSLLDEDEHHREQNH